MIKIIRRDNWCKVIDNDKLIYEDHNLDEASCNKISKRME